MKSLIIAFLLFISISTMAQAFRNEVVIDEIMADPSPQAQQQNGLPEVEFIELKNISQKVFNLSGWKISDASSTATISTTVMLQPDSFLILSSSSAAALLSKYGRSVGLANFPSLDNDGEVIYLTSKEGKLIHAIDFKADWYKNAVKSSGGWTLEMIDTKNGCSGASNWTACTNANGGTPGRKNSTDADNQDRMPPALLHAYATDSLNLIVVFDEPLDSISAAAAANYAISDDIGRASAAVVVAPLFNKVMIRVQQALKRDKVYSLIITKVGDCAGNEIGILNTAKTGIASVPDSVDLVINEILFNPKPDGADYVEIYNRGNKTADLKDLYIANRTPTGLPGSLKQINSLPQLFFPQEYLVISENINAIKNQFLVKNPMGLKELGALPSFPDDNGTVLLLNATGKLLDEVSYSEKWHFKLIENKEGVALEKIDYNKPSQDQNNWHSAATSIGYGTPSYENSQFMPAFINDGTIRVSPEMFSPDNDGFDDYTTVNYQFTEPGYVCSITFFNVNGRPVKFLTRNAICGITGYFRWDGLDEQNNKLPVGIYVMITDIYTLNGKTKKFKNVLVLARRFK